MTVTPDHDSRMLTALVQLRGALQDARLPFDVAGVDEHPGADIERLLGAIHDEDLVRITADAPRTLEVAGEGLAELWQALCGTVSQQLFRRIVEDALGQRAPCVDGELVERGRPVAELEVSRSLRLFVDGGWHFAGDEPPGEPGEAGRGPLSVPGNVCSDRFSPEGAIGQVRGDERA